MYSQKGTHDFQVLFCHSATFSDIGLPQMNTLNVLFDFQVLKVIVCLELFNRYLFLTKQIRIVFIFIPNRHNYKIKYQLVINNFFF